MTEPQVWVLIGMFTTVMLGGMTLMTMVINAKIGGLRAEMDARFNAVDARFNAVDIRFNAVDARFNAVDVAIAHLDRDVSSLTRHVWGERSGE